MEDLSAKTCVGLKKYLSNSTVCQSKLKYKVCASATYTNVIRERNNNEQRNTISSVHYAR